MAADSSRPSLAEARKARAEATAQAERVITELAGRTKRAVQDRLDGMSGPARDYADYAGERFDEAQTYLVDRINEKPVAAE